MSHKDNLAEGMWSHMPTKFSIILWRNKLGILTTFVELRSWGYDLNPSGLPPLQLL